MYPPTTPWRAEQRDLPEHEIFSVHAGGVDRNFAGAQGPGAVLVLLLFACEVEPRFDTAQAGFKTVEAVGLMGHVSMDKA